jgi:hypothetical protein
MVEDVLAKVSTKPGRVAVKIPGGRGFNSSGR